MGSTIKISDVVSQTLPNPAQFSCSPRPRSCFYLTAKYARGTHIVEDLLQEWHRVSRPVPVVHVHMIPELPLSIGRIDIPNNYC